MSRATTAGGCWRPGWRPGWRRRWGRAPAVWRGSSVRHSGLVSHSRAPPTSSWPSPSMPASRELKLRSHNRISCSAPQWATAWPSSSRTSWSYGGSSRQPGWAELKVTGNNIIRYDRRKYHSFISRFLWHYQMSISGLGITKFHRLQFVQHCGEPLQYFLLSFISQINRIDCIIRDSSQTNPSWSQFM